MNTKRRWFAPCAAALVLILTGCTGQAAQSIEARSDPTATVYLTPTATVYSTPTDTPTPEPTATPIPPGSLPPGTQVEMTDSQGFRFAVQEKTGTFAPTYVDDSGNSYTAPPGHDWLVLHFTVWNLLTDRPGTFGLEDFDAIGIYGTCNYDLPFTPVYIKSPTGQCMQNQDWVGWIGSVPDGNYFSIPVGGSAQFDYAVQYSASTDITAMTMWLDTCKGNGDFYNCSLSDSDIPLAGGVHLSAPTNS